MLSLNIPPQKLFKWFGRLQLWQLVMGHFITTTQLLPYYMLCRIFWWNTLSPRWLSPPTAQIWCPVTSSFYQNWNHLWKGRSFRPSMRFRKIQWGQLIAIGKTVWGPRVPILKGTEVSLSYVQCFLYLISSSIKYVCFPYYMAGYLLDIPQKCGLYYQLI